ncbi:trans-L-3-hydroxyproline dehydratase [Hydra vulgaris]|nr:trans-L-3-hydroxyproline dehydratase [Hydra vulgaris]
MSIRVCVTDMHTGGEPLRIITSGYPEIKGNTLLEKRRYVKDHLDHMRTFLMHEPRGHFDQYGALLVEPDNKEADIAVLFMHNEGYSTMCGHAIIALGRYVVDNKLNKSCSNVFNGYAETKIQCPCGMVRARVEINNGRSGAVSFVSVPAFAYRIDVTVKLPSYGEVKLDISFGGAFYALVDVNQVSLNLLETPSTSLITFANEVIRVVKENFKITHPFEEDLSFLYGAILTDGNDSNPNEVSINLCIFADSQLDRSPTGSGVTARMALQHAKGLVGVNEQRSFVNSKTRSKFTGEIVQTTKFGGYDAVQVKVEGHAYYTGESVFYNEDGDTLSGGFLIK